MSSRSRGGCRLNASQRLAAGLSPAWYLAALGFMVHLWQRAFLNVAAEAVQVAMRFRGGEDIEYKSKGKRNNRIAMLCPRQSGKSTVVAGLGLWVARTFSKSLVMIIAPTEKQAQDTMRKIKELLSMDTDLHDLDTNSKSEVVLENGSRIVSKPWSSIRGESRPDVIIMDEAAWIPDEAYIAARPMLTANPFALLIMLTTPHGRYGFFYKAWDKGAFWTKFQVHTGFELDSNAYGVTVVPITEEEEAFKARMEEKGIHAYYSPQHTKAWLEEELDEISEYGWRQEYGLEFLDTMDQVFDTDMIERAFSSDVEVLDMESESILSVDSEPMLEVM